MAAIDLSGIATKRKQKYSTPSELETLAQKAGYTPPKPKGASILSKIFGLLSAGETAPAAYAALKGENPLEAYGKSVAEGVTLKGLSPKKKTYADVLELLGMPKGIPRTALGFAGDVLLDPTTYVGAGLVKGATKVVKPIAKVAGKVGVGGVKLASKLPVVGEGIGSTAEVLSKVPQVIEDAFVPGAKIKRLGVNGEKMWDSWLAFNKATRSEQTRVAEQVGQYAAKYKKTGKATDLLLDLEIPGAKIDADAMDTARALQGLLNKWKNEDIAAGVLKSEIPDYLPHILTDEARDLLRKGKLSLNITKPLRAKLGSAKPRQLLGTIEEMNASYAKLLGRPDFKLFDDDVFRIVAARGVDHVRAVRTKEFLKHVENTWGIKDKDLVQKAVQEGSIPIGGMKYIPYQPEGSLRFYKGMTQPAEDIMEQVGYMGGGKSLEKGMMQTGEILKIADDFGIPYKMSRRLRTALGTWQGSKFGGALKGIVKLKSADPEVAAHEVAGHLLDWALSPSDFRRVSAQIAGEAVDNPTIKKELMQAGMEYGGGGTFKRTEQFAEFMRSYLLRNKTVRETFPKLTKAVDNYVSGVPKAAERLASAKKFINKVDKIIPNAAIDVKKMKALQKAGINITTPMWQDAIYKGDTKAMANLQKGLQVFFPQKSYVGVTKKVPTYLLPEPMAEHLNATYKFLTSDEATNDFVRMYDKALNFWKGSVTGFFPAFHGRNFIGGTFNNWLAGLKNPKRYVEAAKITKGIESGKVLNGTMELGGKEYTYDALRKLMQENGVIGQAGYLDVPKTIEEYIHPLAGVRAKIPSPRNVMRTVENELRGALFIDRLAKGDTAWEAAKQVIKYHFDYMPEGLTTFERTVMKRLMPFYTWTRNNIPLQLEQMAKQPAKYAGVAKLMRSLQGGTTRERAGTENLPEYMTKGIPIKVGGTQKNPEYLYGLGLPVEDVSNLTPTNLLSMLSPAIKIPIEQATGIHTYYQRPISEVDTAPQILAKAPAPIKNWLEYSESKNSQGKTIRKLNPYKWNVITNLLSRGIFTIDRLSDPNVTPLLKLLYGLMGVKGKAVDMQSEEYWRERERANQLQKFLQQKGVLKEFSTYYQPKQ